MSAQSAARDMSLAWTAPGGSKRRRQDCAVNDERAVGDKFSCIADAIREHEEKAADHVATNLTLSADAVLQCSSLKHVLLETNLSKVQESIPIVSRAYEETFLREPNSSDELPCSMGKSCECMYIDDKQRFVGVQYVLPSLAHSSSLCLLCLRKVTHLLFFHTIRQGKTPQGVIQRYGNKCGVENEYHPNAMLICPDGGPIHTMPFPVVAHQRNFYSVTKINGKHKILQVGIGMQDFGSALPPLKP